MSRRVGGGRQHFESVSDAQLLWLTSEHIDGEAFGAFYRRHQDALTAFLVHQTRDPYAAQDLVAETFAIAYSKAGRFDPERGDARRWLFGIARIVLLASHRLGGIEQATRIKVGVATPVYSDEAWADAEARVDSSTSPVVGGLRRLSPEERDAVVARVIEDRDYADIARRQEATEAAVRQRVSRGLRKLGRLVGRER